MTPTQTTNIHTDSYNRLSVQISLTGLSFLVTETTSHKVQYYHHKKFRNTPTPEELLFEIQEALNHTESLAEDFKEVRVIYATNLYTLVPKSLFDSAKASDYLKFNAKILAGDFIANEAVINHDAVVVYVPYVNVNNYLFDRYGSFEYNHAASLLLEKLGQIEKHSTEAKVYVNVIDKSFDLFIFSEGNLQLCNSYSFSSDEDFIYYFLFSLEQMKMNPDTVETILMGNISEEDTLYQLLYTYVRNVSFFKDMSLKRRLAEREATHDNVLLKISL